MDDPSSPNPVANPDFDVEYTLHVEDNVTGCFESDLVTVSKGPDTSECGAAIPWGNDVAQCAVDWNPPAPLMDQNGSLVSLSDLDCQVRLLVFSSMG